MKKIYLLIFFLHSLNVYSTEIPFKEGGAVEYYQSANFVFLGVKIGGPIDYQTYSNLVLKFGYLNDDTIKKNWREQAKKSDDFLVLKVYRGDKALENTVINLVQDSEYQAVINGDAAIIFVDDIGYFGWCDSFNIKNIPSANLREVFVYSDVDLMKYLISNKLHTCLNRPNIRFE